MKKNYYVCGDIDLDRNLVGNIACKLFIDPNSCGRCNDCDICENYVRDAFNNVGAPILNKQNISSIKASSFKNYFTQGYCCAVANLIRDCGVSTEAEDCYRANFHSIQELNDIGVDEFDIEALTPLIVEIERKNNL